MSVSEQPIERVNYFNGQRLVAADFRTDQEYQIAVRRKMNSVLYSSGIVQGLEVTASLTDKHKVVVAPGVALDFLGREIILPDATEVQASGTQTTNPAAIFGNYVVISYAEQRTQAVSDGCTTPAGNCGGNLSWGAATRIEQTPQLTFTDTYPSPTSGLIVLAQVELLAGCSVGHIESGIRRYAVAAKPPTTRPISLEGEKDIDQTNPKTLYFHIDGGVPNSVTLYLRGAMLSTLYYTEMGNHHHALQLSTQDTTLHLGHDHTATGGTTDEAPDHTHNYYVDGGETTGGIDVNDQQVIGRTNTDTSAIVPNGKHTHHLTGLVIGTGLGDMAHHHDINGNTGDTGRNLNAKTGQHLTYVNNLRVLYDRQDITAAIVQYLSANNAAWAGVTQLGDGTGSLPMTAQSDGSGGTGPIALGQLSVALDFSPGQHSLTFQVTDSSGGQIQYNLYVG